MADPREITIITKTHLISNTHLASVDGDVKQRLRVQRRCRVHRPTWIMFAQVKCPMEINHPRHGEGIAYKKRMEVHRYIENATLKEEAISKSKTVNIEEARAEWKFWLRTGFQRITDLKDEGWTHTQKMLGAEPCIEDRPDGMYLRTNKETE